LLVKDVKGQGDENLVFTEVFILNGCLAGGSLP